MSYSDNPTESDDSRFSFLEIDGVGESAQEPADKPAPSAPAPKAEAPARCTRCSVAAPLTAGVCAVCARIAASQAEQAANGGKSPAFTRFWGLVGKRTGLGSMSTDQCVLGALPKLRALLAEAEAGTMAYGLVPGTTAELLKEELVRSLRGLMNRVPQARVDGRKFAPSAATAAPEQTLANVATSHAPSATVAPAAAPVSVHAAMKSAVAAVLPAERPTAKNLIAVDDAASSTGTMTYWALPGIVEEEKLAAAWKAEGLPEENRPRTPSSTVALNRACKEQASKSRLLRAHPEGGWVLVDEKRAKTAEGKSTLAYEVGIRVRLSEAAPGKPEQILLSLPGGKNASEEAKQLANEIGNKIRADFNTIRTEIASVDVSVWLVKYVGTLGGVALRDSGGFYFVPKGEQSNKLAAVARALAASSSHTVYEIPVLQGTKTARAILDGLRIEIASTIKTVEAELSDAEGMGARAARNRTDEITALVTKVEGYAKLFGVPLADIVTTLGTLAKRLTDAAATRGSQLEID